MVVVAEVVVVAKVVEESVIKVVVELHGCFTTTDFLLSSDI